MFQLLLVSIIRGFDIIPRHRCIIVLTKEECEGISLRVMVRAKIHQNFCIAVFLFASNLFVKDDTAVKESS